MPQETSASNWTAIALRNAIHSGDVSAVEVCTGYLDRIQDADVIWFIDNISAAMALIKGASTKADLSAMAVALHAIFLLIDECACGLSM